MLPSEVDALDVSLWMLLLTLASVALYEVYAALLGLWPVVIMNGIFLVLVAFELFLKVALFRNKAAATVHTGDSP